MGRKRGKKNPSKKIKSHVRWCQASDEKRSRWSSKVKKNPVVEGKFESETGSGSSHEKAHSSTNDDEYWSDEYQNDVCFKEGKPIENHLQIYGFIGERKLGGIKINSADTMLTKRDKRELKDRKLPKRSDVAEARMMEHYLCNKNVPKKSCNKIKK